MFRLPILLALGCTADVSLDESSLLQGVPPKPSERRHEQPIANLLTTAGTLLKNGATPDVVEFTRATLDEITATVVPAIEDASVVDQNLLDSMFAQFEVALVFLEEGTAIINRLNAEERAHSAAHKACRDEEASKCTTKITCDYDLYALWRIFIDEETDLRTIQTGIIGHFCPPDANGTLQTFRDISVPHMESFITQKPIVDLAVETYAEKVPQCEIHFTALDEQTATCDAHQAALEAAACNHAVEVRRVRTEFATMWHAAWVAYETTMEEVHHLQLDRIEEFKTLSVVQCLLDRTTERNGRPCDESTDETVTEITHCEEVRHTVDITWLILTYHEVEPVPLACVDRDSVHGRCIPQPPNYPCSESFLEQEYSSLPAVPQPEFFEENSHCNQRPDCQPCLQMEDPEPPLPSPGDLARSRCRRVMRTAPFSIGRAMYGVHRLADDINVCEDFAVTDLYEADFKNGTVIIRSPGIYRIQEDIVMAPETEHMMPAKDCPIYRPEDGYWLGFVAAIAVASDNVFIDLNDKSVSMCGEFALRQRFFSVIQLGDRPFVAEAGPPQFANLARPTFFPSNVVISDGEIGRSAHEGVHGVNNDNIWIDRVHVRDFETGGIQLNGATNIHITNTEIGPSLGHPNSVGVVPGLATLSHALSLLRIVDNELIETQDVAFANLRESVERYITQTLAGGSLEESERFYANENLPDGSAIYGIVLHAAKPAIHDFASCPQFNGEDDSHFFGPATIKNVIVRDLLLQTDEVVHMRSGNRPVVGPTGDVLQIFRMRDDDGNYVGNMLSEAQLAMGRLKNAHSGEDEDEVFRLFGATNIPPGVIEWADGEKSWDAMIADIGGEFVCMKDAMTHHNKGAVGVRIEYYSDVSMSGVQVRNLENVGRASQVSHCTGDDLLYSGNDARGLTMSYVSNVHVSDVSLEGMTSPRGFAYGVEERTDVVYVGDPSYTIDGIDGALGSFPHDNGVIGMLDSDSEY